MPPSPAQLCAMGNLGNLEGDPEFVKEREIAGRSIGCTSILAATAQWTDSLLRSVLVRITRDQRCEIFFSRDHIRSVR
jgi:hypothetical protein